MRIPVPAHLCGSESGEFLPGAFHTVSIRLLGGFPALRKIIAGTTIWADIDGQENPVNDQLKPADSCLCMGKSAYPDQVISYFCWFLHGKKVWNILPGRGYGEPCKLRAIGFADIRAQSHCPRH